MLLSCVTSVQNNGPFLLFSIDRVTNHTFYRVVTGVPPEQTGTYYAIKRVIKVFKTRLKPCTSDCKMYKKSFLLGLCIRIVIIYFIITDWAISGR